MLSCTSNKSRSPIGSIGAAEIVAAREAIDERNMLARNMSSIVNVRIPVIVALDRGDLFTSHSTQRNSVNKSIRCDFNVIRYEFDGRNVAKFVWNPGNQNLADPGSKIDSPLRSALRLTR